MSPTSSSSNEAAFPRTPEGKRLLIAGGGTGGHIYPGLAVAAEWQRMGGAAAFAGVPGNLEARIVPEAGYPFFDVVVHGFTRGGGLRGRLLAVRALLLLLTLAPLRQALRAIRQYRPDIVLGTGGYVSGPVLLAARLSGVPTMILQIDARPGIANRLAGMFVTRIGVALPELANGFRRKRVVRVVGNPIRPEVISATREGGIQGLGLDAGKPTILVFGGSLGSKAINEAFVGALRKLGADGAWARNIQVLHITGQKNPVTLPPGEARTMGLSYMAMEYCDRMPLALASADLVICRSGATSIAELTARGIAAILIPWSGAADNHQEGNARSLEGSGAARVITDQELSPASLAKVIDDLFSHPETLAAMAAASRAIGIPDAAARVAQELITITDTRR